MTCIYINKLQKSLLAVNKPDETHCMTSNILHINGNTWSNPNKVYFILYIYIFYTCVLLLLFNIATGLSELAELAKIGLSRQKWGEFMRFDTAMNIILYTIRDNNILLIYCTAKFV